MANLILFAGKILSDVLLLQKLMEFCRVQDYIDHGNFDGSNIGSLPTIAGEFTHQATQIYDWI